MDTVGIRELKAHLSRHLRRVRSGVSPAVTERGKTIATIHPAEPAANVDWARDMVAQGLATWSGGKPMGASHPPTTKRRTASSIVLEDRR